MLAGAGSGGCSPGQGAAECTDGPRRALRVAVGRALRCRFQRSVLDLSLQWRFANLPNNAKLEMVPASRGREGPENTVGARGRAVVPLFLAPPADCGLWGCHTGRGAGGWAEWVPQANCPPGSGRATPHPGDWGGHLPVVPSHCWGLVVLLPPQRHPAPQFRSQLSRVSEPAELREAVGQLPLSGPPAVCLVSIESSRDQEAGPGERPPRARRPLLT